MSDYHVREFDGAVPVDYLDGEPEFRVKVKIHGPERDTKWLSVDAATLRALRRALAAQAAR